VAHTFIAACCSRNVDFETRIILAGWSRSEDENALPETRAEDQRAALFFVWFSLLKNMGEAVE